MSRYMIHCCDKRKWYVEEYLIPDMLKQGIDKNHITIYNDIEGQGCLKSYIESFKSLSGQGTWHLQDDVVISQRFKELTEAHDHGVVCGFCNHYDKQQSWGCLSTSFMWYSMPCIRIPDKVAEDFVKWFESDEIQEKYASYIKANKHIDVLFRDYIQQHESIRLIWNLYPNIVNHIDHLIGGSTINANRAESTAEIMASYWEDPDDVIEDLKRRLKDGEKRAGHSE
jgi:hypothetical protein